MPPGDRRYRSTKVVGVKTLCFRRLTLDNFTLLMKQVLLVDDSASMRLALRLLLESREQFAVCGEAVDGLDAIEKATRLKPDVILLDLVMPKLNGAEVASALRQANSHVKIVVFTMYADSFRDKLADALGVDLVVSKSDGLGYLLDCLYEVGDGQIH